MRLAWTATLIALVAPFAFAQGTFSLGVARKPDPPIAVDGDLSDWHTVPSSVALDREDQVVFGKSKWTSMDDLSGTLRIAWREESLFIAADVIDDVVHQQQRGSDIWKGDNVMLFIDVSPNADKSRTHFGDGQFQIAFSPGNLDKTGDPLLDAMPEAHCYHPGSVVLNRTTVAAVRTPRGYALEASVPWDELGLPRQTRGAQVRLELAISDSDEGAQQDSMMTISAEPWEITRPRLFAASLVDGVPPMEIAAAFPVFDTVELPRDETRTFNFEAPAPPPGLDAVLSIKARLVFDTVAGYNPSLHLTLNGSAIDVSRLINKPPRAKARGGDIYSMAAGDRFSAYYAPDFESPDTHPHYGLVDGYAACLFELRVTDLLKSGTNELIVAHRGQVPNALVAGDASISFRPPAQAKREKAGPPDGPLPVIVPAREHKTEYTAQSNATTIEVSIGGDRYRIESRFSTPKPGWVRESNDYFRYERHVDPQPEVIVVSDTFTNLTDQPLPLMHRHEATLERPVQRLWLGGLEQPKKSGNVSNPSNPTLCAALESTALGMLPLDDVMRLHSSAFLVDNVAGLADNHLVLSPNATYTAQWAIVPAPRPGYFTFLNAVRRHVDANFTIDGGFAFLRSGPLTDEWSDEQLDDFLRFKNPRYVCSSNDYPRYNGQYTHGTSFQRVTHDNYRASFERWRRLEPDRKYLVYFHCFIDVTEDAAQRFPDSILLDSAGKHADYGEAVYKLFFPTDTNSFGQEIGKNVDIILDQINADGVYWDEHEYSRFLFHYGEPWDGYSGDIDAKTMTLIRKKSSVTLLTEPWRLALAKKIQARGPLIGNGPPFTRAMAALRFPCFVETGSITNCTQSHLHSPIALGDHLTERNEIDAYYTMLAALDFGCVYHWYNDMTVMPTHPHLASYMFPITPLELHEGYIIGEERIVTKKSGLYGWGDMSQHEVRVFDDTGREVSGFKTPETIVDGARFTEIRIGEDWSAVIVRVR